MAGSPQPTTTPRERRFTRNRATRGKGLRRKTGCLTCRRRHVRCNEAKPVCGGCAKRKAACVYDTLQDQLLLGPQTPSPTLVPTISSTKNITACSLDDGFRGENDINTVDYAASLPNRDEDLTIPDAVISSPQNSPNQITPVAHDQTPILVTLGPQTHIPTLRSDADNGQGDLVPIVETATPNINESENLTLTPHGPELAPGDEPSPCHHATNHSGDYRCCHSAGYSVLSPPQTSAYATLPGFSAASISSASQGVETPTARWLGLLIGDALLGNGALPDVDLEYNGLSMFGNSVAQTPRSIATEEQQTPAFRFEVDSRSITLNASLQERLPQLGSDQVSEKQSWHSAEPIKLSPQECRLFNHFVRHISQWIDLFEPKKPFGSFVPHLAMHNYGLINAILALSARHLALSTSEPPGNPKFNRPDPNDAVRYYYRALHYSQEAMRYDTYKVSLELLAISIIISTYEMLDGSSTDWERHLKGVFWIQRSQVIHGDSGGLRQGVWWAWLCQDIWAAFREERKPFTFWRPTRSFDALDPCELAARSVYLFAQAVSFCSKEDTDEERSDFASKVTKADALVEKWNDWREHLTVEFEALPVSTDAKDAFPPIWVHPPAFGVSLQLYYCALILISLHRPRAGGIDGYLEQKRMLKQCIMKVCGIASTLIDFASGVMSSQCVYIAGISVEEVGQRAAVLRLLDDCRQRTGWPVKPLGDELSLVWQKCDQSLN